MKVSAEIITMLNERIAEEHSAVAQYVTHASVCENWGYKKLSEYLLNRAKEEMKHIGMLTDRILYLGGFPELQQINNINVGNTVLEMFPNDKKSEEIAIAGYIEGIDLAVKNNDFGTRKLLEVILEDEEKHLNDIESNIEQITQMGIDNYLPVQIKE